MKLHLLAIGKARGPYADLITDYAKRITGGLTVRELTAPTQKAEGQALLAAIPPHAKVILLDEHGKDLTSVALAAQYATWIESGANDIVFIIGGADGLTPEIRARGDYTLSLGNKTWPHMLARVMLIEQIYRAQQINAGHPYHRA